MRKMAQRNIISVFGILGLISAIWWSLLNGSLGLTEKILGQWIFNMINNIIEIFKIWLPYIVFPISVGCLIFVIYVWIWEKFHKSKARELSTREDKIEEIKKLLDGLK